MAEKIFKGRVRLNTKDYDDLFSSATILDKGEVAIATIPSSDEKIVMMKIGDGVNAFKNLEWVSALASDVFEWAKAEQKPTYTANEINFSDGENFQQKYDAGELTGPKGATGPQGKAGYSPVKGVDYWTTADKQDIVNQALDSVSVIQGRQY